MKRLYALLLSSLFFLTISAQSVTPSNTEKPHTYSSRSTIWQEDFESGTFPPAGWTSVKGPGSSTTHPDQTWHEYTGPDATSRVVAIRFNSDTINKKSNEIFSTPLINLTATTGKLRCRFSFNTSQYWCVAPRNVMDVIFRVSKDNGANWDDLWQEDDQASNEASRSWPWESSEWTTVFIDLSAYAGEIIDLQWNATGKWPIWFYLDDIAIENTPNNDHELVEAYTGDIIYSWDYSVSPIGQTPNPMIFSVRIKDTGEQPVSGLVDVDVSDGSGTSVWVGSFPYSFATTGVKKYDSTFIFTSGFTPTTEDDYQFDFSLKSDDDNSNNDKSSYITINNDTYAHDFEGDYTTMNINYSQENNPTAEVAMGNRFEIRTNTTVYGVDVQFGAGTTDGAVVEVFISSMNDPNTAQGGLTAVGVASYTIDVANDIDKFITIPLDDAVNLVAGTHYIVEVRKASGTEFVYLNANNSDISKAAIFYGPYGYNGAVNYFIGLKRTPAVRMSLIEIMPDPTIGTDNSTVCPSATVNFIGNSSSNSPITKWEWSFPGGTPSTSLVQNPTVTYNAAGINDVTLTTTSLIGITSTTSTGLIQVTDDVMILMQPSNQIITNQNTATFQVLSSTVDISYQWEINEGSGFIDLINGGKNAVSGTTTNTLNYTDSTGNSTRDSDGYLFRCKLTKCNKTIYSNVALLNVYIDSSLAFVADKQTLTSPPFDVVFTNKTPTMNDYSFTWFFGDGYSETNDNITVNHRYDFDGIYDVTLIAKNKTNTFIDTLFKSKYISCSGGGGCSHLAEILPITISSACIEDSLLLQCNTKVTYTYQWELDGVSILNATDSIFYPSKSGDYSVVVSEYGCPKYSTNTTITIHSSPTPPVITSSGDIIACRGPSTLSVPSSYSSYKWSNGSKTETAIVTLSDTYSVEITDANGCIASSSIFVDLLALSPLPICMVGVDSTTSKNIIIWENMKSTHIDSFYIYKEIGATDNYIKQGAIAYDSTAVFIDTNSNPVIQAEKYKISFLDTCGVETVLSDYHKTIHLTINAGVGSIWNLIWTEYEGLTFPSFNIYRGTSKADLSLITTVAGGLTSYSDISAPGGTVYYQIEAVIASSCNPSSHKVKSYSSTKSNITSSILASSIEFNPKKITIHPNPVNNLLTIDGLHKNDYVKMYSISGALVLEGMAVKQVNVNELHSGLYIIEISNENSPLILRERIIVE